MKLRYLNILALMVLLAASTTFGQDDLRTAFGPGNTGGVQNIQAGDDLHLKIVDQTVFPLARCNDNSPAIFYFRPASRPADANKWLIHLQGGGTCGSGLACSERWFGKLTNFNSKNMTSAGFPAGTNAQGIFERDAPAGQNPIENYNQVFVHYCSSDNWSGTVADVALNGIDFRPSSLGCKPYKISFLGRPIFDAVIDTLRQNGVPPLQFAVSDRLIVTMPDLDDADFVILSGGSSGGAGVIHNLDHLRGLLRPRIRLVGLSDSAFRPPKTGMDLSQTFACKTRGACTEEAQTELNYAEGPYAVWGAQTGSDRSCQIYHYADPAKCADYHHILTDHVTTPFFVRMDLMDPNALREYQDDGIFMLNAPDPDPDTTYHEPLSEDEFATAVRSDALSLALVQRNAHERALISVNPGVFSPQCRQHDKLKTNAGVYRTAVRQRGIQQMFDVLLAWVNGTGPSIVVSSDLNDSICPPAP